MSGLPPAGVLGASAESLGRARGNPKENLGASMGTDKGPIGLAQSSLQQARTLAICNLAASGVQCPHGQSNFFFLCLIIVVGIRRLGGRQTDNKETKSNDSEKEGSTCPSIGNLFFSLFESPGDHGVMVKKGVQFQLFQGAVQAAQNPLLHSPIGSRFTIPVCVAVLCTSYGYTRSISTPSTTLCRKNSFPLNSCAATPQAAAFQLVCLSPVRAACGMRRKGERHVGTAVEPFAQLRLKVIDNH